MPNMKYRGETDQKRVARFTVFKSILEEMEKSPMPDGIFITLCGPKALDIGCMRHLLQLDPHQVMFVDNDSRSGLSRAKKEWPGVQTFPGDLKDAFEGLHEPIGLLNADLMGTVNDKVLDIFKAASPLVQKGSVVNFTFKRGRECPHWMFGDVFAMTGSKTPVREENDGSISHQDWARFQLFGTAINRSLGGGMQFRNTVRYGLSPSPMGIITLKRTPRNLQDVWELENTADIRGNAGKLLSRSVVWLLRRGYSTSEVASILNVEASSVAAWKANEARGVYT